MPERVRIEAPDVRSATDLLHRLRAFDARLGSRDDGASEISVESELAGRDLNRLIDDALAVVDLWLAENRLGTVTVHVDGERYSMHPPQSSEQIA